MTKIRYMDTDKIHQRTEYTLFYVQININKRKLIMYTE